MCLFIWVYICSTPRGSYPSPKSSPRRPMTKYARTLWAGLVGLVFELFRYHIAMKVGHRKKQRKTQKIKDFGVAKLAQNPFKMPP